MNIVAEPVIELSGLAKATNGAFSLSFVSAPNASYRLWASTNLTTWTTLGSATQSQQGIIQFTDSDANHWPLRFYRVTCP